MSTTARPLSLRAQAAHAASTWLGRPRAHATVAAGGPAVRPRICGSLSRNGMRRGRLRPPPTRPRGHRAIPRTRAARPPGRPDRARRRPTRARPAPRPPAGRRRGPRRRPCHRSCRTTPSPTAPTSPARRSGSHTRGRVGCRGRGGGAAAGRARACAGRTGCGRAAAGGGRGRRAAAGARRPAGGHLAAPRLEPDRRGSAGRTYVRCLVPASDVNWLARPARSRLACGEPQPLGRAHGLPARPQQLSHRVRDGAQALLEAGLLPSRRLTRCLATARSSVSTSGVSPAAFDLCRCGQVGWPGWTGPIRYGRIISLSSCSRM
jgi:hypothetical protein